MNSDAEPEAILRPLLRQTDPSKLVIADRLSLPQGDPQSREIAPKIVNSVPFDSVKEALLLPRHVDSTELRLKAAMTSFVEHLIVRGSRNDDSPLSHHFNSVFSHAYRAIHHINGDESKTSYNFESK